MAKFGAPLKGISPKDFIDINLIYQIWIEPNKIDILMNIAGVDLDKAWSRRQKSTYDGIPINILSRDDLIVAKKVSGRKQDLLDLERP